MYPPIDPYVSGRLRVDEIHSVYWEECGNPNGLPVVFLHGGPGGGCSTASRRFFDPARYRIVLFDQRGAGRSAPNGELRNNTTADLNRRHGDAAHPARHKGLACLRRVLGLDAGGGLCTGVPHAVLSLTLRGIFLMRDWEIRWLFDAGRLFRPDAWENLRGGLPPDLRDGDPLEGYARLLEHPDRAVRVSAARRWCLFEATLANLVPDPARLAGASDENVAYAMARIEVHYFRNNRYQPHDLLLQRVDRFAICRQPSFKDDMIFCVLRSPPPNCTRHGPGRASLSSRTRATRRPRPEFSRPGEGNGRDRRAFGRLG